MHTQSSSRQDHISKIFSILCTYMQYLGYITLVIASICNGASCYVVNESRSEVFMLHHKSLFSFQRWVSSTTSYKGFQHHCSINSQFVCCDCNMKRNVAFTLIPFAVLKWDDCLSAQEPFELPVQTPVQLLLELEENWIDQNVNELEFELQGVLALCEFHYCEFHYCGFSKLLLKFG